MTFAQFPEGFETTVPPAGWLSFPGANGLGTAQQWQVSNISNTGAQSAYCRYENVSGGLAQDWLVTPQFTPTSSTNLLNFMQRQSYTTNYGSVYKVFISTGSQSVHADFVLVDTQIETDFTYYYTAKEIDLSAYVGIPIYVAFVLEQDDGDNWLIDDVSLTSVPTCDSPTALVVSGIAPTTATVSWTPSGTQTGYNFRLYEGADASTTPVIELLGMSGSLVDTGSFLTGLVNSTQHYFTIESICGVDTSAVEGISFVTASLPIIPNPNYLQEFSPYPGTSWTEAIGEFSSGPTGTVSDWQSDLYTNQGTNTAAKINIYFSNENHWLISPDFDLSLSNYELTLDAAVTDWNVTTPSDMGSDDSVRLLISENYGVTWSVLYTWDTSNTPSNTGTVLPAIDLSPFGNIVRFALLASDGTTNDVEDYDFYIENFLITDTSLLTTPDADSLALISYPNPVINTYTIEAVAAIQEVQVSNILGQRMTTVAPNSTTVQLNFEAYPSGYYFVKILSEDKSKVIKLIKQ
jgi:hypothetical protein